MSAPVDYHRTPSFAVRAVLPHLGEPRRVLDLGCGDGAIGTELRKAWPEADIIGIEASAPLAKAAREARETNKGNVHRNDPKQLPLKNVTALKPQA